MSLKQKFEQKQLQRLIMTPALQQAIELLPLSKLELSEIINQQLAQNPLLEIKEEFLPPEKSDDTPGLEESVPEKKDEVSIEEEQREKEDYTEILQNFLEEEYYPSEYYKEKERPKLENILSRPVSLWDHLTWQANLTFFDEKEREIADNIIGNINQNGYLEISIEEISRICKVSVKEVERIRKIITNFDPIGVGSLNLKECLLTQLKHLKIKDKTLEKIIKNYLHLFERHDYQKIATELGIRPSKLKYYLDIIKSLDPTPGTKFLQRISEYAEPDVIVEKDQNGFKINLNREGIPRLGINSYYRNLLAQKAKDNPELEKYLEEKLKSAIWFLKSLDQRNQTIYKVAKYAIEKQKDFLEKGVKSLKPLTLTEVAEAIGVHESTVSRVVSNKFILTPQGLLPLKFLFPKRITDRAGKELPSELIREKILSLIKNESPENPLSDAEIAEILAKNGINLSRRTVAKYRTQLKIPSSHIRKKNLFMEDYK